MPTVSDVPQVLIDDFLAAPGPILDVRSPGEFQQGHIPGAYLGPLFVIKQRKAYST
ncbi:MAG: rhodanese-like domain-containing protein, partial [Cyanobacteria bacterium J06576_12]